MSSTSANTPLPAVEICEQARLSRDARFDGLFFTAVTSTGIYCRPICPAPTALRRNVAYFSHAAGAEQAGFRPCLRCRPELSPGNTAWRRGDTALARALKLIDTGALDVQSLASLAERVHLGERQLRRLFVDKLGVAPQRVQATRRLLFAKQLLTETAMPVTQVALAAGFRSLRRFNAAFLDAYRMPPRDLRRQLPAASNDEVFTLRLAFRPPYDFEALLDFLRTRALPGIETVDATCYSRVFALDGGTFSTAVGDSIGWFHLDTDPHQANALRLRLHCPRPAQLQQVVARVRRMFDLDADPQAINAVLAHDPRLRPLLRRHSGQRLPGGWDGFEIAVRAILGQQVSVAAARTLATRLVQQFGTPVQADSNGLHALFPSPSTLAEADLAAIGLTRVRAETLRGVARALLDGRIDFRPEQSLDEFVERWTALRGIGPWTAHYIAMRSLGNPDAFPADDLILRRAAADPGETLTARALETRSQAWRPWRAYAVMHLWRSMPAAKAPAKTRQPSVPRPSDPPNNARSTIRSKAP
ncbi:MAG: AlkA N-terminal domain-containing protein [Lysobacteraceae bacterium]